MGEKSSDAELAARNIEKALEARAEDLAAGERGQDNGPFASDLTDLVERVPGCLDGWLRKKCPN